METFSALLAICAGISPVTAELPHKGQWRGALMFSLICAWINGWVNNGEAGDLRRHRADYYVTVMKLILFIGVCREINMQVIPEHVFVYFTIAYQQSCEFDLKYSIVY